MGRTSDARERILEHAQQLFHERGYHAVGISDICAAADVNKGSFYHFFRSKQQLALDVIDDVWHCVRDEMEAQLLGDQPPRERLRSYCEQLHATHSCCCEQSGQELGCALANLGVEMATQDTVLRERIASAFDSQIGYFERLVRDGQQRGEIDVAIQPRRAAEAFFAFVEGKIMLAKLRDGADTLSDLYPEAERLLGFRPA
ncbi:MAG: TetR/AcrR family transcriptional regulator [Thermoanaerobaculia bacterium]|nr:TetR/AcrR family transcriptional regulator [Thermoanaerobaculia bacterium]